MAKKCAKELKLIAFHFQFNLLLFRTAAFAVLLVIPPFELPVFAITIAGQTTVGITFSIFPSSSKSTTSATFFHAFSPFP